MNDLAIKDPTSRNLLTQIMKLQRQIERKVSSTARPGFLLNAFGTFDRQDLTEELLQLFSELIERSPNEDYFRYLFAAALARASRLAEAEAEYWRVLSSNSGYSEPAALMLASVLLQSGKRERAEDALSDYNHRVESRGAAMLKRKLQDLEIRSG